MINCILSQTYSRFTNFAFKPISRFTYLHAYANMKQTSEFELCKEVNLMDEIYMAYVPQWYHLNIMLI